VACALCRRRHALHPSLFPYTTLFRSPAPPLVIAFHGAGGEESQWLEAYGSGALAKLARERGFLLVAPRTYPLVGKPERMVALLEDRKSTRLNSSHVKNSYAVFCLKKK